MAPDREAAQREHRPPGHTSRSAEQGPRSPTPPREASLCPTHEGPGGSMAVGEPHHRGFRGPRWGAQTLGGCENRACRGTEPPAWQGMTGRPHGTGSDPAVDRRFSLRSSAPRLWQILSTLTSGISLVQVTSQGKVPGGRNLERGGPRPPAASL